MCHWGPKRDMKTLLFTIGWVFGYLDLKKYQSWSVNQVRMDPIITTLLAGPLVKNLNLKHYNFFLKLKTT